MFRTIALCLVSVVFPEGNQLTVFWMLAICAGFAISQNWLLPWRTFVANLGDAIINFGLQMCLATALATQDSALGNAGLISTVTDAVSAMLMFTIMFPMLYLVYVLVMLRYRKTHKRFAAFLSHHKASSSVMARFMKITLTPMMNAAIFLDSDDLQDLDNLFEIVGF